MKMLRLAADEILNNDLVRGLRRRNRTIDIVRIQDVGLSDAEDPVVLEWAAQQNRILATHDVSTLTHYAFERVRSRKPMPGVFEISRSMSISQAIEDLILLVECSLEDEWEGQVRYLPL